MGFGPCCVATRKARPQELELPTIAHIENEKGNDLPKNNEAVDKGKLTEDKEKRHKAAKHTKDGTKKTKVSEDDAALQASIVQQRELDNILPSPAADILSSKGFISRKPGKNISPASATNSPVGDVFCDDFSCYPLGYEPIAKEDVIQNYVTQDEVRLHQLRKERNKMLAKTSSEMIDDHMARGFTAKSSSAELMKRSQSPDEL